MIADIYDFLALALFTFLILLALSGNVLVCVAIFVDRKLRRQVENLFLVSLAVSDLFVSVLVMIFAAANDLLGYWPFGEAYCQFWICLDITCSTASILNLCAIAFDRYLHISRPMKYARYSNKSTISLTIIIVWLCSAFIGSAQIIFGAASGSEQTSESSVASISTQLEFISSTIGNKIAASNNNGYNNILYDDGVSLVMDFETTTRPRPMCHLTLRPLYAICSSILSFFLPATIMVLLYTKLYFYARMHVKSIQSQLKQATSLLIMQLASGCSTNQRIRQVVVQPCFLVCYTLFLNQLFLSLFTSNASHTALHYGNGNANISPPEADEEKPLTGESNNNNCTNNSFVTVTSVNSGEEAEASIVPATMAMVTASVKAADYYNPNLKCINGQPSLPEIRKCEITVNRSVSDQKARVTLGVIMGTFLICWLPFFIVNIWRSLFPHHFSQRVFQVVTWLGYANSTANPVIYGIFNRDFRRAFSQIVLKIFYCFDNNFENNNYKAQRSPFFHHSKL